MSKSIVLDLNKSIVLAQDYWRELARETETIWAGYSISKGENALLDIGNSLAYYYKNKFMESGSEGWAIKLAALQPSVSDSTYQNDLIKDLAHAGLQVPKDATLASVKVGLEAIKKSLNLISEVWPAGFAELSHYMSGIVIIESDTIRSLTGPTWFGAIFLGTKMLNGSDLVEISTSLVHEVGHMVLFAQSALQSPLEDIQEEIYSPFVKRSRPALMVFHAQIAMARMLLWLHTLKSFTEMPGNALKCKEISVLNMGQAITEYTKCFIDGMDQLRKITITEGGQSMMRDFESIERLLVESKA